MVSEVDNIMLIVGSIDLPSGSVCVCVCVCDVVCDVVCDCDKTSSSHHGYF